MLEYTEKARMLSKRRADINAGPDMNSLQIRAHHIPKMPKLPHVYTKRKRLSLEELLRKHGMEKPKLAPLPYRSTIVPGLPDLQNQTDSSRIRVSFVNASDLYEIVDYNEKRDKERTRHNKDINEKKALNENITIPPLIMDERLYDSKQNTLENHKSRQKPVEYDSTDQMVTFIRHNGTTIKLSYGGHHEIQTPHKSRRPRRAKRMKLPYQELYAIPELDIIRSLSSKSSARKNLPSSPHPSLASPETSDLEVIQEAKEDDDVKNIRSVTLKAHDSETQSENNMKNNGSNVNIYINKGNNRVITDNMDVENRLKSKNQFDDTAGTDVGHLSVHRRASNKPDYDINGNILRTQQNHFMPTGHILKSKKPKPKPETNKQKAQNRVRKLVYLRDLPNKYYISKR